MQTIVDNDRQSKELADCGKHIFFENYTIRFMSFLDGHIQISIPFAKTLQQNRDE